MTPTFVVTPTRETPSVKICTRCGDEKPLAQFYKDAALRDGYKPICKTCYAADAKRANDARRLEDPSIFTKRSTAWRHANPEKNRLQHVLRTYGLDAETYQGMLEAQDNACAICRQAFTKTPAVDHNHDTGKVRGLLCQRCNTICGLTGDSPDWLRAAITYLEAADALLC